MMKKVSPELYESLVDLLEARAKLTPDRVAYYFLGDGENITEKYTYSELYEQVVKYGTYIQSKTSIGDSILLVFPVGLEYIVSFLACLYAGVVAVPLYPPRKNRMLDRIKTIAKDSRAKHVLTNQSIIANIKNLEKEDFDLEWITTDFLLLENSVNITKPTLGETAFLQYTSGSTSLPKGVIVSHSNLMHNSKLIHISFETNEDDILVSWLPFYHDMGLIGAVLQPLYQGFVAYFITPLDFLQKPLRWLKAISKYKATISGAPNFAYDLCCHKINHDDLEKLDLKSWRLAFSGAEPVRLSTMNEFSFEFSHYGFSHLAFKPCYGMAETTLIVSAVIKPSYLSVDKNKFELNEVIEVEEDKKDALNIVSCGRPIGNMEVEIIHPEKGVKCKTNEIGEIWVKGKSVTKGYWKLPEKTNEAYNAFVKNTKEGPFFRTGDLGFLHDNELYVSGRLKDLIIINGKNHYPQDIELTVKDSHPYLEQSNGGAVFSIEDDNDERLIIVHEVKRIYVNKLDEKELFESIIESVSQNHELKVYEIVLISPMTLPKTSSGKIKRNECKNQFLNNKLKVLARWGQNRSFIFKDKQEGGEKSNIDVPLSDFSTRNNRFNIIDIQNWLKKKVAEKINLKPEDIITTKSFSAYGIGSVHSVDISGELEDWLKIKIDPTIVFDYPTIESLSSHISNIQIKEESLKQNSEYDKKEKHNNIAVIGLSCRFPKSNGINEFWNNLMNGVDCISEIPESRWNIDEFYDPEPGKNGKMYTRSSGLIEDVDMFDSSFFGLAPIEAEKIDPQQRILLEVTWQALEDAGISMGKLKGSNTGVFIGISSNDYSRYQTEDVSYIDAYAGTGNAHSIAANRISYFFDLKGPSIAIDTACSSSLTAIHLACKSINSGECDMAIVGGVNLILNPELTINLSHARMLSPTGKNKTFDVSADGYVRGEGCGVVILKKNNDSIDRIYSLIKGSAINQDGYSNGLTAPNGPSQQKVIRQAIKNAGITPNQLNYVETHGTSTPLGDPIEVNSLKNVILQKRNPGQTCWLGAVKTNIGHLEAAAGIAGFIKTTLALYHKQIPPNIHFKEINPHINITGTPIKFPTSPLDWQTDAKVKYAGVSSFGFGGTNVHVILSNAPENEKKEYLNQNNFYFLTISAKNKHELDKRKKQFIEYIQSENEYIGDICFSANSRLTHFNERIAVTGNSKSQILSELEKFEQINVKTKIAPNKVAFIYTGQGSQYWNMAVELYKSQPVFKESMDICNDLLKPIIKKSIVDIIYSNEDSSDLLKQTLYTQPALFSIEYSLSKLWISWGILPDVVLGHSVGEFAAACISGILELEDAIHLIAHRAILINSLPQNGAMTSVNTSLDNIQTILNNFNGKVEIAAINSKNNITLSGKTETMEKLNAILSKNEIAYKPLSVSHAFHSCQMEPILNDFEKIISKVKKRKASIPFIKGMDGEIISENEMLNENYWFEQLRNPVDFFSGTKSLLKLGIHKIVEIGPHSTLIPFIKKSTKLKEKVFISSLFRGESAITTILKGLAILYIKGSNINWNNFYCKNSGNIISLPSYPFSKKPYWFNKNKINNVKKESENLKLDIMNENKIEKVEKYENLSISDEIVDTLSKQVKVMINQAEAIKKIVENVK